MRRQTVLWSPALKLTALQFALAGAVLLETVAPATAALKQVIIVQSLHAGFPPLLKEDAPERMEIAPSEPIVAGKAMELAKARPRD